MLAHPAGRQGRGRDRALADEFWLDWRSYGQLEFRKKEQDMVIVAGHIVVDPRERERYLADCVGIVEQARRASGCLDFAIGADPVDSGRINIFERWESPAAVEAFRGSGPSDTQNVAMLAASVAEYDVVDVRSLT